jgi:hypothetical protein
MAPTGRAASTRQPAGLFVATPLQIKLGIPTEAILKLGVLPEACSRAMNLCSERHRRDLPRFFRTRVTNSVGVR